MGLGRMEIPDDYVVDALAHGSCMEACGTGLEAGVMHVVSMHVAFQHARQKVVHGRATTMLTACAMVM